ncbi:MAG: carboxy terminal-processing peptidase [Kofleriaceae bacterium]
MRRLRVLCAIFAVTIACSGKRPADPPATTVGGAVAPASPAAATPSAPMSADDARDAALAHAVVKRLEHDHLLQRALDDQLGAAAFDQYLDRLDPDKMFLLAADREALRPHRDRLDDELRAGSLALAREGSARFAARVAVIEPMVAELLAAPMNHDDAETVELDDAKLAPATTDAELRERWRQRLELEVLERTAAPAKASSTVTPPKGAKPPPGAKPRKGAKPAKAPAPPPTAPFAEREAKARAAMATAYAGRFARLKTARPIDADATLLNAVASIYDPHTDYLPPSDKANFDIAMTGQLEGIGAVLREQDHYVEVSELVPGGAAWRQGQLTAGDLILAVTPPGADAVDIADMNIDDVVKMIRGPKGTAVGLKVRKATGDEQQVEIVRDVVVLEASYARGAIVTGKGLPKLGYIYLPSFYGGNGRDAATDVAALVARLGQQGVAGIILDLRGNGGGLLDDAVDLTGLFIDHGPVVQVVDGTGDREVLADTTKGVASDRPLVVMIDRFSASASEIVAGALQDYRRAVIVGTSPTHGKGTVQSLINLDRDTGGRLQLGSLKLTVQQFYRVDGDSTQLDGVSPDVTLPDPNAYVDTSERSLPHAIAASHIQPAPHDDWAVTWTAADLAARSAARVAKQPLFAKVTAAVAVLKARKDDTAVPLARTAWEAYRAARKAALDDVMPDVAAATPLVTVSLLDPPPEPKPGERTDDRMTTWRDGLARDPWLAEAAQILVDSAR